jgi:hypothetical protein
LKAKGSYQMQPGWQFLVKRKSQTSAREPENLTVPVEIHMAVEKLPDK